MTTRQKLALLGALYLAQGVPYGFFAQALPVALRQEGLSLPAIGLAHLLALPWALKLLLGPALDRRTGRRGGRRRGVIVPLQLASAAVLGLLSLAPPGRTLAPLIAGTALLNALAAAQDVATDALAVELLTEAERGLGNGVQVAGYRVGMVVGGGLVVAALPAIGWTPSLALLGLALLAATVPILRFREEPPPPPESAGAQGASLLDAARAWLDNRAGRRMLALLVAYKAGEALAQGMLRPFLVDAGMSLADVGAMLGVVGFSAGLLGALAGGALAQRWGRRAALAAFAPAQAAAVALYALLAHHGSPPRSALYAASVLEHLASGMATAALFTAMMDRCRPGREATDYALQACVVVVATGSAAAASGAVAAHLGYEGCFAAASLLCLAGALPLFALSSRAGERMGEAAIPSGTPSAPGRGRGP